MAKVNVVGDQFVFGSGIGKAEALAIHKIPFESINYPAKHYFTDPSIIIVGKVVGLWDKLRWYEDMLIKITRIEALLL
ncbi:hypothetical protein [Metabacillus sp. Hm71]|uniref:hypothetical protein n=1 Tax=Metabacillus sp. Hm71 TaxID=3450743 RepID=UPI003F43B363